MLEEVNGGPSRAKDPDQFELDLRRVEDPDHPDRDLFELVFTRNGTSIAYVGSRDELWSILIKFLQRLDRS